MTKSRLKIYLQIKLLIKKLLKWVRKLGILDGIWFSTCIMN